MSLLEDVSYNRDRMGPVDVGLWVGSVWSVQELIHWPNTISWTVVSVNSSPQLTSEVHHQMEQLRQNNVQVNKHIMWNLEDKVDADFLSVALSDILSEMDKSIDPGRQRACLVHCAMGLSRSVAICAAWLICSKKYSLSKAMDTIRMARPDANPNLGFLAALRALEQSGGDVKEARNRIKKR